MRIIGIDPGYAILGYGVVDKAPNSYSLVECGVLTTDKGDPMPERLKRIYAMLMDVIAEFAPDAAAVEELFFNSNAKTAIKVGEARGAAILACANSGLTVYEYTPLQVKQAIAGYGRADKRQMQELVTRICGLSEVPQPDDAADAVAAAICHGNSAAFIERVAAKRSGGTG
ncbi:MAG: crossover junction endodeoxyribonuclease RuvC [Clostridiales Family XIII bacterium]|jgi:crossover junction endodeoxyribonuclease RuvC|nr:crossover junction endodeoxyribonuclease RuvC [Clostridiales Family XIII bacterium]